MSVRAIRKKEESRGRVRPGPWAPPPIVLAKLREGAGDAWIAELGAELREVSVDPSVDPALLREACDTGARVVLEGRTIVGVIATRRAITVDREGRVDADVTSFSIHAREEVVLKTAGAFVRAKAREVEVYGDRVLTRARDVAKILAAMIKLN